MSPTIKYLKDAGIDFFHSLLSHLICAEYRLLIENESVLAQMYQVVTHLHLLFQVWSFFFEGERTRHRSCKVICRH